MKIYFAKIVLAAAGLMLAPMPSNAATTVFTDTFDSGTGDWYRAYTGGNAGTLTNDDGRLSFTQNGTGGLEVIGRSFSTQTIPVGGSLTVSFDFRQTSATGIFRIGFYEISQGAFSADNWASVNDETYAGYTTFIRNNGSNIARRESATFTTSAGNFYPTQGTDGNVTDITSSGGATNFTFANDTDYQFSFSVTRVSETQTDTLLTVMQGVTERYSVLGSHTSTPHLDEFNTLVLRTSSGTALYDNMQLTFIPEPSVALLGGLGMLALLRRRR